MATDNRTSDQQKVRTDALVMAGCGFAVLLCLALVGWGGLPAGRWLVARVRGVRGPTARSVRPFSAPDVAARDERDELRKQWQALAREPAYIPVKGPALLCRAAELGDVQVVRFLLDAGVDPDATPAALTLPPGPEAEAPQLQPPALHAAASHGCIDVMRILVERGADVNSRGPTGDTALHTTVRSTRTEALQWLLDHGADTNLRDHWGRTPLAEAMFYQSDASVPLLLIESGADVKVADQHGQTPLHKAVTRYSPFQSDRVPLAKALLDHGADPNACDRFGDTPLHEAVGASGEERVVALLLDNGADATAPNQAGLTPLHCAAIRGALPVARLLVDRGAEVNARAEGEVATEQQDASWWALPWWQREGVRLCPPCRAERQGGKFMGETPFHIAAAQGHIEVAELLLSEGAAFDPRTTDGLTPLHGAAYGGHEEIVRLLLARGADVNAEDVDGWTPLHEAVFGNHRGAAGLLLKAGARQDICTAAGLGEGALVESYLDADPRLIHSTDSLLTWTPLHWAANGGDYGMVALLLKHGPDVNARDFRDWTPLRLAELGQHEGAASLLRNSGGVQ